MAASGDTESDYRRPFVSTDEEGSNWLRVCVVLPGLQKKRFSKHKLANGELHVKFLSRSIDVITTFEFKENGRKKSEKFRFKVKKLPHDISPEKSVYKVENDKVILHLYKLNPVSWLAAGLDTIGLETDETDDDDK